MLYPFSSPFFESRFAGKRTWDFFKMCSKGALYNYSMEKNLLIPVRKFFFLGTKQFGRDLIFKKVFPV